MSGKAEIKRSFAAIVWWPFRSTLRHCSSLHTSILLSPHLHPSLSAGALPSSAFLVAVSYVGCNHILTVIFLTLCTTLGGASAPGIYVNQLDIAPR